MYAAVICSFAALDAAVITQLGYALHQLQRRQGEGEDSRDRHPRSLTARDEQQRSVRSGRSGELLKRDRT